MAVRAVREEVKGRAKGLMDLGTGSDVLCMWLLFHLISLFLSLYTFLSISYTISSGRSFILAITITTIHRLGQSRSGPWFGFEIPRFEERAPLPRTSTSRYARTIGLTTGRT